MWNYALQSLSFKKGVSLGWSHAEQSWYAKTGTEWQSSPSMLDMISVEY